MQDSYSDTAELTGTTTMGITQPEPSKTVRVPLPPRTLDTRFFCSHCGGFWARTVKLDDHDAEHPFTLFCNPKCARANRVEGLGVLNVKMKNEVKRLLEEGLRGRAIADQLKLSPAAVEAFTRDRYTPNERQPPLIYNKTGSPPVKRGRPSTKEVEDDIFAPLHGMMIG